MNAIVENTAPTSGTIVDLEAAKTALTQVDGEAFVEALAEVVKARGAEEMQLIVSGLEIMRTPTAFREENQGQLNILSKALVENPFAFYLEHMGVDPVAAKREHLMDWWDTLMSYAAALGYQPGGIDGVSRETNLWKATANLSMKMRDDPASFQFLPAVLINHPSEVDRVLNAIKEPIPFVEVLVGEAIEDIEKFQELVGAMSTVKRNNEVSNTFADGLLTVHQILQRG